MKILNSILGKSLSGSMDNLIVYEHRDRQCARRKPSEVKPPLAPGQVAQQERMASIAIFYQALKEVGIYPYWRLAAEGMVQNGYNLLVQRNLPAFGGDGRICDFSKLRLTMGTVALPDGLQVRETSGGEWTVGWENTPFQVDAEADDRVALYVMRDKETFAVEPLECGDARRRDGGVTFRVPEELGEYGHLYVVFLSGDGGKCSESKYFNMNLINHLNYKDYGTLRDIIRIQEAEKFSR